MSYNERFLSPPSAGPSPARSSALKWIIPLVTALAVCLALGVLLVSQNNAHKEYSEKMESRLGEMQEQLSLLQKEKVRLESEVKRLTPPPNSEIKGEMFIATKGGVSYKLGAVDILVFDREKIDPILQGKESERQKKREELDPKITELRKKERSLYSEYQEQKDANMLPPGFRDDKRPVDHKKEEALEKEWKLVSESLLKILQESIFLGSGEFIFSDLPRPIKKVTTNADGFFKTELPAQKEYVLAAQSKRAAGGKVEKYYWLVAIDTFDQAKEVSLNNNNLTTTPSGSLIRTVERDEDLKK